jgi:hypothetical protein
MKNPALLLLIKGKASGSILSFYHIYPVALTIVFGGIAAYFMPPVEQPEESRFAGESGI